MPLFNTSTLEKTKNMQIDTSNKNTNKDNRRKRVLTSAFMWYTHGCICMCVGINVSRYESTTRQSDSLNQVNE